MKSAHFFHNRQINYLLTLLLLVPALDLLWTQMQAAPTATDCIAQTEIPQAECETLVALYNSTDGPNWSNNFGWNVTDTPCSWYGVTCSGERVQDLYLVHNGLSGTIPDLSALTGLQEPGLNDNQLSGDGDLYYRYPTDMERYRLHSGWRLLWRVG